MPWFRAQQPAIDWRNGKLLGMTGERPEASVDWICSEPVDARQLRDAGRSTECTENSSQSCSLGCQQSCPLECLQHSAYPGACKFGVSLKVLPASDFARLAEELSTAAGEGSRSWIHCIGLRQDLLGARSEGSIVITEEVSGWPSEQRATGSMGREACSLRKKAMPSMLCSRVKQGSKETLVLVLSP